MVDNNDFIVQQFAIHRTDRGSKLSEVLRPFYQLNLTAKAKRVLAFLSVCNHDDFTFDQSMTFFDESGRIIVIVIAVARCDFTEYIENEALGDNPFENKNTLELHVKFEEDKGKFKFYHKNGDKIVGKLTRDVKYP